MSTTRKVENKKEKAVPPCAVWRDKAKIIMSEFSAYYIDFIIKFFSNFWEFIKSIGLAFYKAIVLDIGGYFSDMAGAAAEFDVWGWILLILSSAIILALVFFLVFRLVQLIRRYILYRSKEVEKDKLMEEVAALKLQTAELTKEKNKIFALKVGSDIYNADAAGAAPGGAAAKDKKAAEKSGESRFTKLINLDQKYERDPHVVYMDADSMLQLNEIVQRFINFSASQLRLYYKPHIIRQYLAGLATSKIMILEGISGTGKTSLPYAMSKFFNNDVSIVSVQPSWRDRAELMGYFNEFTKKFNETDFLASLYEATLREDPNFIVLDEMNLARIEYYFADFLSIMEMPDVSEWKIDLIPAPAATDPKNIVNGKLLVPQNVWFIGTANNDDSTFTVTDKVYDRAVSIILNEKAEFVDAPLTESFDCTAAYLESLYEKAWKNNIISDKSYENLTALDEFIQTKFKIGFGNRIMKQLKKFVPVYMACGGSESEGLDFIVTTKILRKFNSLNLPFLMKELGELIVFIEKKFGKGNFNMSINYIKNLQKMG